MRDLLYRTLSSKHITEFMNAVVGHYVTIYMIHRPRPLDAAYEGVSPELLEQCIVYAQNAGFEFASIDEVISNALAKKKSQRPTLCFTLDDGYQDQLDQLVPVLLKYKCKPTLFAIVDMIDEIDWPWDSKLSYAVWNTQKSKLVFEFNGNFFELSFSCASERRSARRQLTRFGKTLPADQLTDYVSNLLTSLGLEPTQKPPIEYRPSSWENLRQAESKGLRIGSHACSHRVFTALSDTQVTAELQRAQNRLESELQNPSNIFCYPSGTLQDFSQHHIALVKNTDFFIGAVTSISGNISQKDIDQNPFLVKRHSFPDSFEKFVRYSSWLEYIRSSI